MSCQQGPMDLQFRPQHVEPDTRGRRPAPAMPNFWVHLLSLPISCTPSSPGPLPLINFHHLLLLPLNGELMMPQDTPGERLLPSIGQYISQYFGGGWNLNVPRHPALAHVASAALCSLCSVSFHHQDLAMSVMMPRHDLTFAWLAALSTAMSMIHICAKLLRKMRAWSRPTAAEMFRSSGFGCRSRRRHYSEEIDNQVHVPSISLHLCW